MLTEQELLRIRAAKGEAFELGYHLLVDEAVNIEPPTYMAIAFPVIGNQPVYGRFLTYGMSTAETAEEGLDILRGVVERDDPWPPAGRSQPPLP